MEHINPLTTYKRELEKEALVTDNENLLIILIFTHDFKPEMSWLSRALNAPTDSVEETARILQGYGYLLIAGNENDKRLTITPKGKRLVLKIRSKQKAP